MGVIEISSSPEPPDFPAVKRRGRRLVKGRGKGRARTPVDIIDITNSDSDPWAVQEIPSAAHSAAGPSTSTSVINITDDEDPLIVNTGASTSAAAAADALAQVLEIVPDVEPNYAQELIAGTLPTFGDKVVETVLHFLFEDAGYPKAEKRRRAASGSGADGSVSKKVRGGGEVDYASTERPFAGGPDYADLAIEQLTLDFPSMPKPFLRKLFREKGSFYAPTYLHIVREKKRGAKLDYIPKKTLTRRGKGKERAEVDAEFEREKAWLDGHDEEGKTVFPEEEAPEGEGFECGCCFSEYPFNKMVQCPEAHLFCSDCLTAYTSTQLGAYDVNILCMDQSGCKRPFPESELRRFLSPKLMELYERVKQRKEIEAAGLDGLEECPFCEFKCVIENPDERLFRCGNEETCGAITCRSCKKVDHLPKSCKEMEEDRHLDGRHTIEEAMTKALMRNCPKCQKAFIKEAGCNKMMCPNCQTLSCYVCRQVITGYDHFNPQAPGASTTSKSKKCPLWDTVELRHYDEVRAAAERATAEYHGDHPDIDEADIKVDLPKSPNLQQTQQPYHHANPPQFHMAVPPGVNVNDYEWDPNLHYALLAMRERVWRRRWVD
ncbi:uncharacterized protein BT62DRAFT_930827 [Guyanagaster necrorhizus]|uniref:RING-type domain-containing protein n=1 Tax=Guyanagaster necrorhizus TaxID=856835 RepID=A0A9P8AU90_9AGAR|nr:uncharacterized protein BT62DRAFT_930827 [Guyanagaster necrorhizus MCA 3950]KAG7447786.1 hypothetical protein BT62DRAFT_930827 [Guyanagaster necrorhizus MCA 3950]